MLKNIITKPILATVLSLIVVLLGLMGMGKLPITRFPEIAPPSVQVSVTYPGASAETVAQSVLLPIEEAINGVDNMTYIESRSSNSGAGIINVYFKTGTNPDQAAVNVQTRVSRASSQIPSEVIEAGISVMARQRGNIMTINLYSDHPDRVYDETFLQAYSQINLNREILRVQGVAAVSRVGARDYSMRAWLNPEKIAAYGLTPQDITKAIREQNFEIAPGKFGETSDEVFETPLRHSGRFSTPEEYENIAVRTNSDGSVLYLKDVARIEFGASNVGSDNSVNGHPGLTLNITQTAGSNARDIDIEVRKVLERIKKTFPPTVKYDITYSVKDQIDASINQVKSTLLEAFILVFIIVFLFLQDFRSTIIPVIAIPVSLVGTFFFIYLLGFSINVLTMFAMVLAIGIVVDDAIVVVEAIHEKMHLKHLKAKQATLETMDEIKSAILSITMVMAAVFIPVGFMEGPAGIFYKQFAYTLAIAILISAFNALTLTPALCALFLKPQSHDKKFVKGKNPVYNKLQVWLDKFFEKFNKAFDRFTRWYGAKVEFLLKNKKYVALILVVTFGLGFGLMKWTPSEFIPTEDDSYVTFSMALQPGASLSRTKKALAKAEEILKKRPEILGMTTISGYNTVDAAASPSFAVGYINLRPINERGKVKDIRKLIADIRTDLEKIDEATFQVFPRPTVQGFGDFSGVEIMLQDKLSGSFQQFDDVAQDFIERLNEDPSVSRAFTSFNARFPQYMMDINYVKAKTLGVNVKELMSSIRAYYGRVEAGNFSRFGRQYRVYMSADVDYKTDPSTFSNIFVKNSDGEMLPANTLVTLKPVQGPETVNRFNLFNAISVKITPAAGSSSGDVMAAVDRLSKDLPANYGYELTGLALEEKESGSQTTMIFGVSFLFIYLLLSAQYESFLLPFAILLSVPTGFLGTFGLINLVGVTNNIYVQVGIIMLIGLLAKNAILIVEFALKQRREGMSIIESAKNGALLRIRPILMTSFAFVAGLIPLMFSQGPSAQGNHSISFSTAGGMLAGVIIGIFLIPALYAVFQSLDEKLKMKFRNDD